MDKSNHLPPESTDPRSTVMFGAAAASNPSVGIGIGIGIGIGSASASSPGTGTGTNTSTLMHGSGARVLASSPPASIVTNPLAYPRRAHRKSRTGCATCKVRKIKCDERHPSCLNCISHGVECPYSSLSGKHQHHALPPRPLKRTMSRRESSNKRPSPPSTTHSSGNTSPSLPRSPNNGGSSASVASPQLPTPQESHDDPLPLLELELLHNFTILTWKTLAVDEGVCEFWRTTVVGIGLSCDYIMRAVLAISALHLAYHQPDPERRDFYTTQGIIMHQRATRLAMQHMAPAGGQVDQEHEINLFLFSLLTLYFALASPRRSLDDGSFMIMAGTSTIPASTDPYTLPENTTTTTQQQQTNNIFPDWMFLLNGAKSISNLVDINTSPRKSMLSPFLDYGGRRWRAVRGTETRDEPPRPPRSLQPLDRLRSLISSTVTDPDLLTTYAHAIAELEMSLLAREDPTASGMPCDVLDSVLWLWEVNETLLPLLKQQAPAQEAVAIFAHYCVLLKHHEGQWWLGGWGDHLMRRAWEVLDEEHRGWVGWAAREVGIVE